jgi:hypothetical protein
MIAPGHQELKVVMSKQSESGISINLEVLNSSVVNSADISDIIIETKKVD